jgi:membrane protease subunit HflC
MNSSAFRTGLVILAGVLLVVLYASTFVVQQTEQALVLQFGRVRSVIASPGLYFKLPFVENVVILEKRVLDLDLPVQTLLSADRQNLEVDAFARFRIEDPLRFYQAVNNLTLANQRMTSFVNSSMRNVLASASRDAIVRTQRAALMNQIQDDVSERAKNIGIEIIDLRLTRVDLPAANSQAVYQRMQTERQREAADLRANGQQLAQAIRAKAEREATVIRAEATRQSETLRGQGDGEKNRILAEAFNRDPNFFAFYRSMQAYEAGLKPDETRLLLSPNSEFLRYFRDPSGGTAATGSPPAAPPGPTSAAPAVPAPGGSPAPAQAAVPAQPGPSPSSAPAAAAPAPPGPAASSASAQ